MDNDNRYGISAVIPEVIVEEGDRGKADGIRDSLPPDKVIDIDYGDPEYIVPLDLTEVMAKLGRDGASRFADEIVDFLQMGDLSRSKHILRVVAKASGGSLMNIKRIIEDEEYREQVANQGITLQASVEAYRVRFGFYPKAVLADQIYRTRENLGGAKETAVPFLQDLAAKGFVALSFDAWQHGERGTESP